MVAKPGSSSSGASSKKKVSDSGESRKSSSKSSVPTVFITRPITENAENSYSNIIIHPSVIAELGLVPGGICIVSKEGQRGVAAIVKSSDTLQRPDVIQLAAPLRSVGGILLGDRVYLKKVISQPTYATTVTVGTVGGEEIGARDGKIVQKLLNSAGVIMPGMVFDSVLLDNGTLADIIITDLDDDNTISETFAQLDINRKKNPTVDSIYLSNVGIFRKDKTQLFYTSDTEAHRKYRLPMKLGYSSVGGLASEIQKLKETIEAPLYDYEFYQECGVQPPRGILLHGPPGTGKTMLLRCVANESNAHTLIINGPSITSKYLGETEEKLRAIFDEAREFQPSIVLIDELDSIAPNRDNDDSGEAESRVVATLLTLMDGVENAGSVAVVATTNRPNKIDPALRRPGRFNTEVEIGVPDVDSRLQILKILVAQMNANRRGFSDEEVAEIAAKTHGYVGTDLSGLCTLSVAKAKHRAVVEGISLSDLTITMADLEAAMLEIKPSAMREIFLEMPKVYWSDIAGQEQLKLEMEEVIQLPLKGAEKLRRLRVMPPKGVLLYGPPGCSKTLTAKALATESGFNFFAIKGPEVLNKYVGETERTVRELFRKAKAAAPSIIFIDEIDELAKSRDEESSSSAASNTLITLLNEIDGVEELKGVVVVAATNKPEIIDPALIRSGRLDKHLYVAPPNFEARLQILKNCSKTFELDPNEVDLNKLAEMTEDCSGAAVSQLCRDAAICATTEDLVEGNVKWHHFKQALTRLSRDAGPEVIKPYEAFAKKRGLS
ncbi:HCL220Cp [Eremothecium sinecaudum]|uniref:HCL220Cp n=1 Tax=Eremothecium sinecaudum TaxID=45286 RepID=A0A0X8HQ62_9SACH|nr:HCL220Cp [Eremothecium sinecaudum]AMD19931.1 HCL220Cp [Eremothecium sinecaudum]